MRVPRYFFKVSCCFLFRLSFTYMKVRTTAAAHGTNLFRVSPSPSCPFWLSPHTQTSVSVITSLGGGSVSLSLSAHRQQQYCVIESKMSAQLSPWYKHTGWLPGIKHQLTYCPQKNKKQKWNVWVLNSGSTLTSNSKHACLMGGVCPRLKKFFLNLS